MVDSLADPALGNDKDRLVHWCHGAPGVIATLAAAHGAWGGERYLAAAVAAGEVVWRRGLLRKGPGLCHGTAGNGYSLLQLYQATGDRLWLYRASCFATWCCNIARWAVTWIHLVSPASTSHLGPQAGGAAGGPPPVSVRGPGRHRPLPPRHGQPRGGRLPRPRALVL